jgi:hypothetical protein
MQALWLKYGHWLVMLLPILGWWFGVQRGKAQAPQAPARGAQRTAARKAAGDKARVDAETATTAAAARTDAAADAAGEAPAVVDALNKRRGRK